jgi:ABC-type oligopeptide transport system ATPase subunit
MIEVRGLCKRYGSTLAVDDLSFDVLPGRVTGFLGPNGAGKSTTMRMILGLDHPSSGTVRVLDSRRHVGVRCTRLERSLNPGLFTGAQRVQPPALPGAETASGARVEEALASSDCRMWDADEPVACRSA